jgi:hypothetical protein
MRGAVTAFVVLSLVSLSAKAEAIQIGFGGTIDFVANYPPSPPLDGSIQSGSAFTGVLQIGGIDSPGTPSPYNPEELDYSLAGSLTVEVGDYQLSSAGLLLIEVVDSTGAGEFDQFAVIATGTDGSIASSLDFTLQGDSSVLSTALLTSVPFDLSRWANGDLRVIMPGGLSGKFGGPIESLQLTAPEPAATSLCALVLASAGLALLPRRSLARLG